jgi:hypothetical protein
VIESEIQTWRGVANRTLLTAAGPGDRMQLQQVILNLVMKGIEALSRITDRSPARELVFTLA